MQTFLMVVVIVVLMAPLLLFYGVPFIALATLFDRAAASRLRDRTRRVLACGIAALGIAPAFDQFWAPKSIYLRLFDGDDVGFGAAVLSLVVTWAVVTLHVSGIARLRSRRAVAPHAKPAGEGPIQAASMGLR